MSYAHPFFQNTTAEELKTRFDEIQESLPELMIDEFILDED